MKKNPTRSVLAFLSALTLGAGSAWAQAALPADEASSAKSKSADSSLEADDQIFQMDPFTVTTEHEGYKADDTLAGGRVRTSLKDTPSSISVVTKKFLQDLAINDAQDLLVYTNNTEVAGLGGNFSGVVSRGEGISVVGAAEGTRLTNPAGVNRARGLTGMDSTRNYFLSKIPWDGYNISRVDISRGPNSFLFGVGSPSGIANVSTNTANFKDSGSVEAHVSSFGSTRQSVDFNKVIVPNQVAVRLDMVNTNTQFEQEPAFNRSKRIYGALRVDPKFLDTPSAHTRLEVNYEYGKVDSNNPRTLPPLDYVTGYLKDPNASATGYNPWTYRAANGVDTDAGASSWSSKGSVGNQYAWGNGAPQFYWDAATGSLLSAGQASFTAPTTNGYGSYTNTYHVHTTGYGGYAGVENARYLAANNNVDGGPFKGARKGTVRYLDQTLSDPSVFDFYHKLIDGDNKREWQRWNAFNVNLVQSLFNDRLVVQAVMDHEEYRNGNKGILNSRTPALMLDLDSHLLRTPTWLPGAQANPNVGRPLVFGDQGNISIDDYTIDNYQVTAAYSLNFEKDFANKGAWTRILGRHEFTGLGGRYTTSEAHRSYRLNGIDPNYQILTGNNAQPRPVDNGFNWVAYVGPNLLGKTGAGADLSNLQFSVSPFSVYPYTIYSKTWKAGSSVSPTAPWTYTGPDGNTVTATQADNPANYVGYTGMNLARISGDSLPDVLATGGNKKIQRITAKAFMYQGHFWDDTIIPSFGYRKDETFQRGNDAQQFWNNDTHIYRDYNVVDEGIKATTTSKSWGLALHLPKSIKKNLPEGTDLSFYYFHGANETPKVRYAIDGSQLPNEKGNTDDYSVQYDGLNGKLTVRLTYFKTENTAAQASYGQPLGGMGWKIDAIPSWTLGFAAFALAERDTPAAQLPGNWPYWTNGWFTTWAQSRPEVLNQIAETLKTDFVEMFPQTYWDAYGYGVNVDAIKRGDWIHVSTADSYPSPWTFAGSHQIHGEWAIIDQNLESKGYELEATFRPMKNWDITFNGSKVSATQTSLGAAASTYLNGMAKLFMDTPLSKVAIWGGYSDYGATKQDFMSNLWAPYLLQVALTGADQPEMRKYKFNVISNYRFDQGALKGLNVGGAFRWEDRSILGYGLHEAEVYGEKAWIADVNQPIYGPTDQHFDAWIGYQRKLNSKITWRVQLNVRNVGESNHLVTVAVQPDGSVAQSRIAQGSTYDLSCRFSF